MNNERRKKTERSKNVGPPSESHTENRKIEDDADCQAALERLLAETPDFVPTRGELLQLVKYWSEVKLNDDWSYFCYPQTGSDSWGPFAACRIGKIARLLGDAEVVKVIDEVYAEFGKQQDQRYWNIFLNGDEKQWEAASDEIWREAEEHFRSREKGECPENE